MSDVETVTISRAEYDRLHWDSCLSVAVDVMKLDRHYDNYDELIEIADRLHDEWKNAKDGDN